MKAELSQYLSADFLEWFEHGRESSFTTANHCQTRADFNGRLQSYERVLRKSFQDDCLYLLAAALGEIGNNSFDHNMGHWKGLPGCLFIREERFSLIADRGQGIAKTLSAVYRLNPQDKNYINVAFNKVVSGRAPENRGNGLKFTKKIIEDCHLNLYCFSQGEEIFLGRDINGKINLQADCGTLTIIHW